MLKDFKDFISKGNVIDLAVAVIIGAAFALIVKAFTENILMPIIGIVGGKPSFDDYTVTVNKSVIGYGSFLTAVVNFVIIAFALFLVVKALQKSQNMRQREEVAEAAEATEIELLTEIRDLLVAQSGGASPAGGHTALPLDPDAPTN